MSDQESEPLPLGRYEIFRPAEVEEGRDTLFRVFGWNVVELDGGGSDPELRVHSYPMRDMLIGSLGFGNEVHLSFRAVPGINAVVVPLSGTAAVRVGAEHIDLVPGYAVITSDADLVSMQLSANFRASVVRVEQQVLEAVLAGMIWGPLQEPLRLEKLLDLRSGYGMSWQGLWQYFMDELDRPGALIEDPGRAQQLEYALLDMLLYVHQHNYVSHLIKPGSLGVRGQRSADPWRAAHYPAYLRKALELIEEHPEWDHRTKSLAQHVSISERMLQLCFKEYLGVTPKVHLKNVRLDRVHETLLASSPYDTNIDQIVRQWGFHHYGHFAAAYQERFNERPLATLRRSLGGRPRRRVPGQRTSSPDDRPVQRQEP